MADFFSTSASSVTGYSRAHQQISTSHCFRVKQDFSIKVPLHRLTDCLQVDTWHLQLNGAVLCYLATAVPSFLSLTCTGQSHHSCSACSWPGCKKDSSCSEQQELLHLLNYYSPEQVLLKSLTTLSLRRCEKWVLAFPIS
jgi:hypothetical protein